MSIRLTELVSNIGTVAKKYIISADGTFKTISAPAVHSAKAYCKEIALFDVAGYLDSLCKRHDTCIILGSCGEPGSEHSITTDDKLVEGKISRSQRFFQYANSDAVSLMLLDFDGTHSPELRQQFIDDLDAVLSDSLIGEKASERKTICKWIRPSSSSSASVNGKTGTGLHVFLAVRNANPELISLIHKFAWLSSKDYQGYTVNSAGQVRAASLIDPATAGAERIVYSSDAIGEGSLEFFQEIERKATFVPGGILDSELAINTLEDLVIDFDHKWNIFKRSVEELPEVTQLRKKKRQELIDQRLKMGMDDKKAKQSARSLFDLKLLSFEKLLRNDGTEVLVKDILCNPDEWIGQTHFCDPIKRELHRNVGKIMGDETAPILHSMSHGNVVYKLLWSFDDFQEWATTADPDEVEDFYPIHLANLEVNDAQLDKAAQAVSKKVGASVAAIRKTVRKSDAEKKEKAKSEKRNKLVDEDATHSELAIDYIQNAGECISYGNSLYVWKEGATVWEQQGENRIIKNIGIAYREVARCGRANDYRAVQGLVVNDADLKVSQWLQVPGFPCVDGFWIVGKTAVEKVEYKKEFGCRFKLGFKPDFNLKTPYFDRVLGNIENPELYQQLFGLALCGYLHKLQKVFIMFGTGGTGKGTSDEIMMAMLPKKRVKSVALDKLNDPVYAIRLADCHINLISEVSDVRMADLTGLKKLSGGGQAEGKALYNNPDDFYPTCSFVMSMNKFIPLTSTGNEVARRFADSIVHFQKNNATVIDSLASIIIESELPGVLAWAIEGVNNYLRDGLYTDVSRRIFEQWTSSVDSVEAFAKEYCQFGRFKIIRSDLWKAYKDFCDDANFREMRKGDFFDSFLKKFKVAITKNGGNMTVDGVKLK